MSTHDYDLLLVYIKYLSNLYKVTYFIFIFWQSYKYIKTTLRVTITCNSRFLGNITVKTEEQQSETCKRLMEIPGVEPLIAKAEVATMEEASAFKSGREFAAYVGLVPNQTGSGGSAPAGG